MRKVHEGIPNEQIRRNLERQLAEKNRKLALFWVTGSIIHVTFYHNAAITAYT